MNEIVPVNTNIIRSMEDAERAARSMVASGFFQDTKQAAQAVVKILAGQELGFGPFASMTGVHIIQNKPTLAANLMAAAVKRTGKYNYRVVKHTDAECSIDFYENGEKVGNSTFTMADASKAGLNNKDNWKKYPRNLLFARALSNGQKWFAPDVFNGATVYTPEELGASVDQDGNVIDVTPTEPTPQATRDASRPYTPEQLKEKIAERVKYHLDKQTLASPNDRKVLASILDGVLTDVTKRYELCNWLVGQSSTQKMKQADVVALFDWLGTERVFNATPVDYVVKEIHAAHTAALKASGQQELIPQGA